MAGIFVSYRQADAKAWAISLRDDLAKVFGADQVFLDKDTLHAGNWRAQIQRALDRCQVMLVVIGPRWLTIADEHNRPRIHLADDVHHQEIAYALGRSDVTVIPVLVDEALMPRAEQLPQDLRALCDQQARKIGDTRARRQADLEVLVKDIVAVGGIMVAPPSNAQDRPTPTPDRTSCLKLDMMDAWPRIRFDAGGGHVSVSLQPPTWRRGDDVLAPGVLCAGARGQVAVAQIDEWTKEEHMSKHSAFFAIHVWYVAMLLAQPLPIGAPAEVSKDPANTMEVICLTEQPAIVEGESATLKAWASTPDGQPITQPITFQWEVDDGRITTQAAEARWDLSGVKVEPTEGRKKLVATVRVTEPGESELRCAVEVFIGKQETAIPDRGTIRGEKLASARRYLLPGEPEEPGYGLYSYLLFSNAPMDTEEKDRYLKTVEAYLLLLQDLDEYLGRHVRPSRLNATYIPLKKRPNPGNSNAEWAANVLAVYDYTAAEILLSHLDKSYLKGPYLVSVLKPLSEMNTRLYLFEDFTGVVPELVAERVKFFKFLAAQERSWSEESLERFTHKLRNLVAVGGKVAPDALKGLARMIRFERGL